MNGLSFSWITTAMLVASVGCAAAAPDTYPVVQTETAFLDACEKEWVQREPSAAPWARGQCGVKWRWAMAAGPMAEAILALSLTDGDAVRTQEDARTLVSTVRWSSDGAGTLDDAEVSLRANGISFGWQQPGSEGRFNVIDALRSRGVTLQSLGCPQYPMASMGREKVMLATFPRRQLFTLTVYSRGAPTGFEPGIYEVDADFSGAVPDMDALRGGHYPGGGGRAFAVDPTGWVTECPDPE